MRTNPLALLAAVALAASGPSEAVQRRAFVTSVTGKGNLAGWQDADGEVGLAAGDEICRNRAATAGLPNANAYRAWLSTASTDAYCHVRGQTGKRSTGCAGGPPQAAGPWYRVPAPFLPLVTPAIAESLDALVAPAGEIYRPVLRDEFGESIAGDAPLLYWTGTGDGGTQYPDGDCSGWVSAAADHAGVAGDALATAQLWTLSHGLACNQSLRLLCLEPGASEPTGQRWRSPGSIVFLTSVEGTGELGSWPQAGAQSGLAAGDAICRTLAAQAHLPAPASFVAWLSDNEQDARDRLTSDGPFRRIDGVAVASSKADLLDGTNAGSIHQFETGAYKSGSAGGEVFTGTYHDGTTAGTDCSGWTSVAPVEVTKGSGATTGSAAWSNASTTSCGFSQHLFCLSNVVTLFWDGFESGDASAWSYGAP